MIKLQKINLKKLQRHTKYSVTKRNVISMIALVIIAREWVVVAIAHEMNMEDIFSQFGDIFGGGGGSPFDSFFGGGGRNSSRRGRKGSNLRIKLKLSLEEIANGVEKNKK